MPANHTPHARLLDRRALLLGLAAGTVLVVLEIGLFVASAAGRGNALTMLVWALLIYGPTGAVTGWQIRRPPPSQVTKTLPASVQALVAGLLLALLHALLLLASNAGFAPGLSWFLGEAVLASLFASLAGGLAAFLRRRDP